MNANGNYETNSTFLRFGSLWGNRLDEDEWIPLSEGLMSENCKVEVLG